MIPKFEGIEVGDIVHIKGTVLRVPEGTRKKYSVELHDDSTWSRVVGEEALTVIDRPRKPIEVPEGVTRVQDRYGNVWHETPGGWSASPHGAGLFETFDQLVRSPFGPVRPQVITYGDEISA